MYYSVRIPSQGNPAVESFLDREHFVQTMLERSAAQYAVITREEFLQRFLDEEEAREHSPEVMEFFDAGIPELLEYTLSSCGPPQYAILEDAPSKAEVAQMIMAHDLHGAHELTRQQAEIFITSYRGHQWMEATNELQRELKRHALAMM